MPLANLSRLRMSPNSMSPESANIAAMSIKPTEFKFSCAIASSVLMTVNMPPVPLLCAARKITYGAVAKNNKDIAARIGIANPAKRVNETNIPVKIAESDTAKHVPTFITSSPIVNFMEIMNPQIAWKT